MSRGTKLDLSIGAKFEDGWSKIEEQASQSQTLLAPNKHQLIFRREKRKGKVVILVGEFFLEKKASQKLLKKLKSTLACGGSFKDGFMEFQGEAQERLRELLEKEGFRFKR